MTDTVSKSQLPPPRPIERIVLIAEEGFLFSGDFLSEIINRLVPRLIMVAAVKPHRKSEAGNNLLKMWRVIGIKPIFCLAAKRMAAMAVAGLPSFMIPKRKRSLKALAKTYKIPYAALHELNTAQTRNWLSELQPDIVISSVTEILKADLLSIPAMGFLNKHAAILPAYGGLMPVVHAMAMGEPRIGMSVHLMSPSIDNGPILSQRAYDLQKGDTVFKASQCVYAGIPDQVDEALSVLEGKLAPVLIYPRPKPSYFSVPTLSVWKALRQKGRRLL